MRFSELLTQRLRHTPGNPLITFYDDTTGERTELSLTTYANWVAKTANVLLEEFDLSSGDIVSIELGPHWLTPIFLGAVWLSGAEPRGAESDTTLLIGGPSAADDPEALACSLHPFGLPFPNPVSAQDFGFLWPNQPDVFLGNPGSSTPVAAPNPTDARIITDIDPASSPEILLNVLHGGGSLVIVRDPDPANWSARSATERATVSLRN